MATFALLYSGGRMPREEETTFDVTAMAGGEAATSTRPADQRRRPCPLDGALAEARERSSVNGRPEEPLPERRRRPARTDARERHDHTPIDSS